ncbi:HugZ family protein [Spirulina major]|uniref:HugZ family pyridoxamine 5'-phosphate oxidase n=1 Tax=Spirulina major TaxID=270636 RepID=UPI000933D877|nr:pyridoxamine 5'-phosphate oxidase family protein [Spirulina major]
MTSPDDPQSLYLDFPHQFQSLVLSTVSGAGVPHASYAPFVINAARQVYVLISGLAIHTQNMLTTQRASVMWLEDEAQCQQIFARRRLTYDCTVTVIEREAAEWEAIADQFEARFGAMVKTLRSLEDFQLVCLTPQGGRFVMGFGAAYRINGEDLAHLYPLRG